jgi:ribosomal protein S18 acetylase RimI-like enzyme
VSPTPVEGEGEAGGAGNFVRDARPADAADLARIQVARWASGYRGLVPDRVLAELTTAQTERLCHEQWTASLAQPPTTRHRVLVAVTASPEGARLVAGFASFGPATDPGSWPGTDAELYELCVAPGHTGHGHGSRLLNAAAATLAEDGFGTACAWVLEQDTTARRFLESSGWAADGARRALDMGDPVPTIRLHTTLSPAAG